MQVQNQPQSVNQPAVRFTFAAQPQNKARNDRITFGNLPGIQNMFESRDLSGQTSPLTRGTLPDQQMPKFDEVSNQNTPAFMRAQQCLIPIVQGPRAINPNVFETQYPSITESQAELEMKNPDTLQTNFPNLTESQVLDKGKPRRNAEPKLQLSETIPVYQINLNALEDYQESNQIPRD